MGGIFLGNIIFLYFLLVKFCCSPPPPPPAPSPKHTQAVGGEMETTEEGCLHVFPFSVLTLYLYYGIVIIASRRSAMFGLCSFAKTLLDFALIHVSFVPASSEINVFKKFPSV